MKYLHIVRNDKFTEPFINFINENFDSSNHFFLFMGGQDEATFKITKRENIYYHPSKFNSIIVYLKMLYKSEKIYIHGLFNPCVVFFMFMQPWILKKSNWIVFGADLYYYKNRKKKLKNNLYELLRKRVIRNINEISTLVEGDYDLAVKWYGTKARYCKAKYTNLERIKYLDNIVKHTPKKINKSDISILIGNSATPTNNHKEALDLIAKFKSENIKIYCPLSYGDEEYAKEVVKYGESIFGEKFVPIYEYMDLYEYMELLNSIDIGIFNNNRQQALGNISSLLYLGKKVYLRNNTAMWDHFVNNYGLEVFNIEELKTENFNSLINMPKDIEEINLNRLRPVYDKEALRLIWEKNFLGENVN